MGNKILLLFYVVAKLFLLFQIRPDRQTLYWSATWPKEVEQLARKFLFDPYKVHSTTVHRTFLQFTFPFLLHVNTAEINMTQVTIGSEDLKANHAIVQHVEILSESQKYNK